MGPLPHFSITDFYIELKKSADERTAKTIAHAFERFKEDQETYVIRKTAEEIHHQDLASKKDLLVLKLDLQQTIAIAKWQVMGTIALMLFTDLLAKHFGF